MAGAGEKSAGKEIITGRIIGIDMRRTISFLRVAERISRLTSASEVTLTPILRSLLTPDMVPMFEKCKDGGVETQSFDLRARAKDASIARKPRLSNRKKAELNKLDSSMLVMLSVGQSNGTRIVAALALATVVMIRIMRNPLKRVWVNSKISIIPRIRSVIIRRPPTLLKAVLARARRDLRISTVTEPVKAAMTLATTRIRNADVLPVRIPIGRQ